MSKAKAHVRVGDVKNQIKATKGINAESKGWQREKKNNNNKD